MAVGAPASRAAGRRGGVLLLVALLLGGCRPGRVGPVPITAANYLTAIPDPKTLGEAYVSDPDGVLAPGTAPALNARLDNLDRSGRAHLDVVLVRSLGAVVLKTGGHGPVQAVENRPKRH